MRTVRLASETDIEGWRTAARALRRAGAPPSEVRFTVAGPEALLQTPLPEPIGPAADFTVPRAFVDLCANAGLHASPDRFDLLYRLLWRLTRDAGLLREVTDPDVALARRYEKGVLTAIHKMHAFVRFRRVDDPSLGGKERYAAWFEPRAYVLERVTPWFVDRLANVDFALFTPYASAFWDGAAVSFGPGADPSATPAEDAAEEDWRAYFSAVFNPARLNQKTMTRHMPKGYWRNLPEARDIGDLVAHAPERARSMLAATPTLPPVRVARMAARAAGEEGAAAAAPPSLGTVDAAIGACRRCGLWREATGAVPGVGPPDAAIMLVGEQPGDAEDLRGLPFVGPAGQVLDEALAAAGVPRDQCYVTNAVKHFKHELRGKRRLHRTPSADETQACRWWLDMELALVRPKVIVALGGTAAASVLQRPVQVLRERGRPARAPDGTAALVTVHPSYILRLPDAAARAQAMAVLIDDLRTAAALQTGAPGDGPSRPD